MDVLDLLRLVPDPAAVHRRLGETIRAERLLRRLLRLSVAVREELARRSVTGSNPSSQHVVGPHARPGGEAVQC